MCHLVDGIIAPSTQNELKEKLFRFLVISISGNSHSERLGHETGPWCIRHPSTLLFSSLSNWMLRCNISYLAVFPFSLRLSQQMGFLAVATMPVNIIEKPAPISKVRMPNEIMGISRNSVGSRLWVMAGLYRLHRYQHRQHGISTL